MIHGYIIADFQLKANWLKTLYGQLMRPMLNYPRATNTNDKILKGSVIRSPFFIFLCSRTQR